MKRTDFARRAGSLWLDDKLAVATLRQGHRRYVAAWVLTRPHRIAFGRTRDAAINRLEFSSTGEPSGQEEAP